MNKVIILSIMLVSMITAPMLTAIVPQAYAKKNSERQAGYRNGAVDVQKVADDLNAGRSSGVDANNPHHVLEMILTTAKDTRKDFLIKQ